MHTTTSHTSSPDTCTCPRYPMQRYPIQLPQTDHRDAATAEGGGPSICKRCRWTMCACHAPRNMKNRKQQSHGDKTKLFPKHLRQQTQIRFCGIKAKFDMRCRVTRGGFRARVCLRGLRYIREQVSVTERKSQRGWILPSQLYYQMYLLAFTHISFLKSVSSCFPLWALNSLKKLSLVPFQKVLICSI